MAAGSQDVGDVERESDGADDVIVLEDQKHLTGVSVPDLGREVGGGRGSNLVVGALLGLPGCALVAYEGADPVASAAMSQDRVAIWWLGQWLYWDNWARMSFEACERTLAGRDNKILSIFLEAGEADVGDRARVAVAGQGQVLSSSAVGSHGNCEEDLK